MNKHPVGNSPMSEGSPFVFLRHGRNNPSINGSFPSFPGVHNPTPTVQQSPTKQPNSSGLLLMPNLFGRHVPKESIVNRDSPASIISIAALSSSSSDSGDINMNLATKSHFSPGKDDRLDARIRKTDWHENYVEELIVSENAPLDTSGDVLNACQYNCGSSDSTVSITSEECLSPNPTVSANAAGTINTSTNSSTSLPLLVSPHKNRIAETEKKSGRTIFDIKSPSFEYMNDNDVELETRDTADPVIVVQELNRKPPSATISPPTVKDLVRASPNCTGVSPSSTSRSQHDTSHGSKCRSPSPVVGSEDDHSNNKTDGVVRLSGKITPLQRGSSLSPLTVASGSTKSMISNSSKKVKFSSTIIHAQSTQKYDKRPQSSGAKKNSTDETVKGILKSSSFNSIPTITFGSLPSNLNLVSKVPRSTQDMPVCTITMNNTLANKNMQYRPSSSAGSVSGWMDNKAGLGSRKAAAVAMWNSASASDPPPPSTDLSTMNTCDTDKTLIAPSNTVAITSPVRTMHIVPRSGTPLRNFSHAERIAAANDYKKSFASSIGMSGEVLLGRESSPMQPKTASSAEALLPATRLRSATASLNSPQIPKLPRSLLEPLEDLCALPLRCLVIGTLASRTLGTVRFQSQRLLFDFQHPFESSGRTISISYQDMQGLSVVGNKLRFKAQPKCLDQDEHSGLQHTNSSSAWNDLIWNEKNYILIEFLGDSYSNTFKDVVLPVIQGEIIRR